MTEDRRIPQGLYISTHDDPWRLPGCRYVVREIGEAPVGHKTLADAKLAITERFGGKIRWRKATIPNGRKTASHWFPERP